MPEDRSLDDFAGADDATASAAADSVDSEGDAAAPDDAAAAPDDAPDDATDVAPAVATSAWHADGAECVRCGERVERRWREAEAFVCADCASW